MAPPPSSAGFWHRLRALLGGAPDLEPPTPPLFRLRPVPPPPPKGPGLPPLDDLLTEPPPITEAMLRSLLPPEPPPAPPDDGDDGDEGDAGDEMADGGGAPLVAPPRGVPAIDLVAGERPLVLAEPVYAAPPAVVVAPPAGAPGRLLEHVALTLDEAGAVCADSAPVQPPTQGDATTLALALRLPGGPPPTPVFIEAVLALFALHRAFLPHLRPTHIYVGRQPWAAAASGALEPQLLAVLFPGIRVVADLAGSVPEARVLLADAGLRNAATDTLIGGMMPHVVRHTVEARQRAFAAFGLPATAEPPLAPGRRPQALFLHSAPPRALADPVRERLVAMLRRSYDVRYVDVARLEWRRQVRLGCGADLIVGAHSPAMAAVLWGHPQARVLEFFPEGTRRYDGQLLAEAAALAYLGLEGVTERGFVIRARERWGPPAGDANRLVWALPWAMLEQALLARSAAAPRAAAAAPPPPSEAPPPPPDAA
jgi:hypothetical protein